MIGPPLPLLITLEDVGSPFGLPFGASPSPGVGIHPSCS